MNNLEIKVLIESNIDLNDALEIVGKSNCLNGIDLTKHDITSLYALLSSAQRWVEAVLDNQ